MSTTISNFISSHNNLYVTGLPSGTSVQVSGPTFLMPASPDSFSLSAAPGVTILSTSSSREGSLTVNTVSFQYNNQSYTSQYNFLAGNDHGSASCILNDNGTYTITSISGGVKGSNITYYVPSGAAVTFSFSLSGGSKAVELQKFIPTNLQNVSTSPKLPTKKSFSFTTNNPSGASGSFTFKTSGGTISDPTVVSEPNSGGHDYPDAEPSEKSR